VSSDVYVAIDFGCPCCDAIVEVYIAEPILPGYRVEATCSECGTRFIVEMRYEIEDDNGKENSDL
jgi:hypothetical protein